MSKDRSCELPESKYPYQFMRFKTHLIAVNEEHGCFIYDDDECWKLCHPVSNNPLTYHQSWYFRA